ncbi:hypothetical protein EDB81DRAFT_951968 [Dactylonectria macrodidyma]|uniref:Uncharacterized protein n=1 Tax=Dactylonectria macrodidyma TaxID=307937 RepID=A0A9P9DPN6_9HYPO|nr:hypothetical protein EDB81DRAFT_951968 [Dactylonectria macrodidyma]
MQSRKVHEDSAFRPGAHDPAMAQGVGEDSWMEGYDYEDSLAGLDINWNILGEGHYNACWSLEEQPMTRTLNPPMLEDHAFQEQLSSPEHYEYDANLSSYGPPSCTAGNVPQNL